jgi:hypothetical protein
MWWEYYVVHPLLVVYSCFNLACLFLKLRSYYSMRLDKIHRFVTKVCFYNYHNSGHYPLPCLLFKTQLNFIGLSVPHREHISSLLRAQQVNAVYRFVTLVY